MDINQFAKSLLPAGTMTFDYAVVKEDLHEGTFSVVSSGTYSEAVVNAGRCTLQAEEQSLPYLYHVIPKKRT